MSDYDRIARAIEYIVAAADRQPQLEEIAAHAGLSTHHFQRLFSRWAGTSPKRFLQVVTLERAKRLLADGRRSLLQTSEDLGLSSQSRLYDHFVQLEAVTPGQFSRGGDGLEIRFGLSDSPFGPMFVATTGRGICALSFPDPELPQGALSELQKRWPGAELVEDNARAQNMVSGIFSRDTSMQRPLTLTVRGTNFQLAVWNALLRIPPSGFVAYGDIATAIGRPGAARAVGTAVGANPCAWLIPCHRVIRETGELGGYRWGLTRKRAMCAWEAVGAEAESIEDKA